MRRSLVPSALLAVALSLGAPSRPARAEDVVTKVDGARLRGEVIQDPPELVKIKTAGGVITIPRGRDRFKQSCDGVKENKDGVKFFEELFNKPIQQIEDAWKDYVRNLK